MVTTPLSRSNDKKTKETTKKLSKKQRKNIKPNENTKRTLHNKTQLQQK